MQYGAVMFATDYAVPPVSCKSPWPGGAPLPREYWHTLDPFVALGSAATATSRIKLGTGICLVIDQYAAMAARIG